MIDGTTVVAFTPWGRENTASILFEYMKRDKDRGILDEWWLCENTDEDQESDRAYAKKLADENDWIKVVELDPSIERLKPKQQNTKRFYKFMTDSNTVYLRFDDDIVYVHEDAIERLVRARISKKAPFVIFPIIWNNAVCSYYLQQTEAMPSWWGVVKDPYCMDSVGWADPNFAIGIHNHLLDMIESGTVEDLFLHHDIQLPIGLQFSVSCFAQTGEEYAKHGDIYSEEESWHTMEMPYETGRPNMILSNSLVSHFSFYHQRNRLLETDILDRYRGLAKNL
jgi:hypothetical protein